jgi:membrane fusion protein, adhesin transport system
MSAYRPSKMLSIVSLTVVLFIVWSTGFDIDQTVRAQGQLIPGGRTQVIQVVDGGVLSEIRVQEGDTVKAGQTLAVLEPDRAKAAFDEAQAKHTALRVVLKRAQAEAMGQAPSFGPEFAGYPDLVAAQKKLYAQRKQSLDDALAMQKEAMGLAKEELQMNERLFASGDISRVEVLRARRQVSDIQSRIFDIHNKYLQDARTEAARQEEEISSQRYRQEDRRYALAQTELTAPVDGVVKYLRVTTVGGVLRAGDELMQISPTDGESLLELKVNPADIGQLQTGMRANIRLDAYDYAIYGALTGELVYLSSDTLQDQGPNGQAQTYYRARVRLLPNAAAANPKLQPIVLKPGLTATVDILTGQRSVMRYLIKPIARGLAGALNER